MWDRAFLNRLRKEIPGWAERGWVTTGGQAAILDQAEAKADGGHGLARIALAIIGALTLGAGIILFFAANWDGMSKAFKLAVMFGFMWGAYAVAGRALAGEAGEAGEAGRAVNAGRVIGHAMLLLGVILFGANIMLIAQIYHIDTHYPNGVLLWALGALALVWVLPSQPVTVAGLALATLWSGMEIFDFDRTIHWPFLVVWALFLGPALYHAWNWATGAALLALMTWCFMITIDWRFGEPVFMVQIYVLAAIAAYVLGGAMRTSQRLSPLSVVTQRTALVALLCSAHSFIYVGMHGLPYWYFGDFNPETWARESAPVALIFATLAAIAVMLGLTAWHYVRTGAPPRTTLARVGVGLAALAALLFAINVGVPDGYDAVVAMYVAINGLAFAALLWLVAYGYASDDRFPVYTAFLFFAAGLIAFYFNDFWSLMSRSLFAMGGGMVLVGGVWYLERQKRRPAAGAAT